MEFQEKNKGLNISKNELGVLSLIKEGLFGTCKHLMSEEESQKILKTRKFKGEFFPYPLSFATKNNEELLKNESRVNLFLNDEIIGHIDIKNVFKSDKNYADIFNPNETLSKSKNKVRISGEFELYNCKIKKIKSEFLSVKKKLNAKKITALFSSFDPLHRAHERMFRWMIDKADLVVVFLIESYKNDGFDFALKEKYVEKFIQSYLPPERIFIFPLKDIDIFHSRLNPALETIVAKNLGCTKFVVGQNHAGLGMFYDGNQPKTILNEFSKDYDIEIIVLPEFVFCNKCRMIVSTRSCPHGNHHHLHYDSNSLKSLLRAGLIPPAVFMRKEVSSTILSSLFPKRFKNMQQIYYSLFPTNGILEYKKDEEFYQKLLEIHQMSYMV
ncbi:MAG: sulfate adenylyltransferase [Campylobacter sp.]|nr:sulfate adenylyltransferase [Campylobacter sp.]